MTDEQPLLTVRSAQRPLHCAVLSIATGTVGTAWAFGVGFIVLPLVRSALREYSGVLEDRNAVGTALGVCWVLITLAAYVWTRLRGIRTTRYVLFRDRLETHAAVARRGVTTTSLTGATDVTVGPRSRTQQRLGVADVMIGLKDGSYARLADIPDFERIRDAIEGLAVEATVEAESGAPAAAAPPAPLDVAPARREWRPPAELARGARWPIRLVVPTRRAWTWSVGIAAIPLALGASLHLKYRGQLQVEREGRVTTAVVTKSMPLRRPSRRRPGQSGIEYAFVANGTQVTGEAWRPGSFLGTKQPGERIEIIYLPSDPTANGLRDDRANEMNRDGAVLLYLVAAAIALVPLPWTLQMRRLRRLGVPLPARVTKSTAGPRGYSVNYEFTTPTGTVMRGSFSGLAERPAEVVTVLWDPGKPNSFELSDPNPS